MTVTNRLFGMKKVAVPLFEGLFIMPNSRIIRICNPFKPSSLVVNSKELSIGLQILIIRTGGLQIRRNELYIMPNSRIIRICNPLKPSYLVVNSKELSIGLQIRRNEVPPS